MTFGAASTVSKTVMEFYRLPPLPTVRDLLRLYRLRAIRQLSQNFLMDERLTDKIVRAAGRIKDGCVCEVGPGPGGITRSIINRGAERVIVIEKDKRFNPSLELLAEATGGRVKIIFGDILSFKMDKLFPEESKVMWEGQSPNIHLIGNLPFNVSTPLIIKWIHDISVRSNAWSYGRTKMLLTFQKEVAERITAPILSSQRCRLSIMCQNWCSVNHKFNIPGKAFIPKPDVDVGVVHFTPLVKPVIPLPFHLVEKVVRNVFSFRQKYSIRGAECLFPGPARERLVKQMYMLADINPTTRPFQLTVEEIGRLCYAYKTICDEDPRLYKYESRAQKDKLAEFEEQYDTEEVDSRISV